MKTWVIYHKSDFDGIFCREIAKRFLTGAELIGWDYGDPEPVIPPEDQLYILDLSVPGLMGHPNLIWIDHHKSAIEKYPSTIRGYRIDGVAACRLAWQWFTCYQTGSGLPGKELFVDRKVIEPHAVTLAGEYDIWDKRDPDAELFQHGLRSRELTESLWDGILAGEDGCSTVEPTDLVLELLDAGRSVQYAKQRENTSIIGNNGFTLKWEGLTFLACNASNYNSLLFEAGTKPEHDALLGFCLRGNGKWTVSLYGAPGRPEIDLSVIAKKYGGGGHRQACGFTCAVPPFLTPFTFREGCVSPTA